MPAELDHLTGLVEAFVMPAKRDRVLELLSKPKRRRSVAAKLYRQAPLDPRYVGRVAAMLLIFGACTRQASMESALPPLVGDREVLLRHRVVEITGPIEDGMATEAIARLLFLEDASPSAPVFVAIDSPGGSAVAGLALADTIRDLQAPVRTVCRGEAGGVAVLVLATAKAGSRMVTAACRVTLGPPSPAFALPPSGEARRAILGRMAALSGLSAAQLEDAITASEAWSSAQAIQFGVADLQVGSPVGQ